jgi:hypothetical protein
MRRTGLPLAPTITSPKVPELRSTPRRPARAAGEPAIVRRMTSPCAESFPARRRHRRTSGLPPFQFQLGPLR